MGDFGEIVWWRASSRYKVTSIRSHQGGVRPDFLFLFCFVLRGQSSGYVIGCCGRPRVNIFVSRLAGCVEVKGYRD